MNQPQTKYIKNLISVALLLAIAIGFNFKAHAGFYGKGIYDRKNLELYNRNRRFYQDTIESTDTQTKKTGKIATNKRTATRFSRAGENKLGQCPFPPVSTPKKTKMLRPLPPTKPPLKCSETEQVKQYTETFNKLPLNVQKEVLKTLKAKVR